MIFAIPQRRAALIRGRRNTPTESVYDFTAGLPSAFTLSRTGTRYARASSAKWASYASNMARLHHDDIGAPIGVLFERAHTDKCLIGINPLVAPSDTTTTSWFNSVTDVSAVTSSIGMAGTGWEDLITSIWRETNASGSTVNYQHKTTTGNTNKHSFRALLRSTSTGGTSVGAVQISGGSQVNLSGWDAWEELTLEDITPTSTSRIMQTSVRANSLLDIAFIQLAEAKYLPTPILHPTDNASVSVGNEYASASLSSFPLWSTSEVTVGFEWFHEWPFTVDNGPIFSIAQASAPTTNYLRVVGMADATMKIDLVIGGASVASWTFAAPTRRTICRAVIRLSSGSFLAAINGVGGMVDTNNASWGALDTVYINRLDTSYSNCIARSFELSMATLSDSQVIAASAPNQGGFI